MDCARIAGHMLSQCVHVARRMLSRQIAQRSACGLGSPTSLCGSHCANSFRGLHARTVRSDLLCAFSIAMMTPNWSGQHHRIATLPLYGLRCKAKKNPKNAMENPLKWALRQEMINSCGCAWRLAIDQGADDACLQVGGHTSAAHTSMSACDACSSSQRHTLLQVHRMLRS